MTLKRKYVIVKNLTARRAVFRLIQPEFIERRKTKEMVAGAEQFPKISTPEEETLSSDEREAMAWFRSQIKLVVSGKESSLMLVDKVSRRGDMKIIKIAGHNRVISDEGLERIMHVLIEEFGGDVGKVDIEERIRGPITFLWGEFVAPWNWRKRDLSRVYQLADPDIIIVSRGPKDRLEKKVPTRWWVNDTRALVQELGGESWTQCLERERGRPQSSEK